MATFATTAAPNNATAAVFRAWAKAFHDAMTTTGGWIHTADTGQINFATVAAPGAANTKMGYAVYRMNDTLQATNPIFMKVAFGSASLANYPGIWFGIGTATDGAGNLIDPADANRAAMLVDQTPIFQRQDLTPNFSEFQNPRAQSPWGSYYALIRIRCFFLPWFFRDGLEGDATFFLDGNLFQCITVSLQASIFCRFRAIASLKEEQCRPEQHHANGH